MKKLLFCVFAVSAFMISACSEDETLADATTGTTGNSGKVTFVASIEQNGGASPRTTVEISGGQGDIMWSAGDAISVVNTANAFDEFTLSSGAGTTTATFDGEFAEGTTGGNIAIYPAGAHSYNGSTLTVNLPETYGNTETTYTPNANVLMIAQKTGDETMLLFKHLGGVLYFDVDVPAGATSVSLTAKGICGDFTVNMGGENATIAQAASAAEQTVTYKFKAFEETSTQRFYFPVPTGDYKDLTICVSDEEGTVSEIIDFGEARTLDRATIAKLKYLTSAVLAAKHKWVDLGLPSGTLWATKNVGATSPTGYGDLFAWGEVETKTSCTWENYKWANGAANKLTKYVPQAFAATYGNEGYYDDKLELEAADDAATVHWGAEWTMPTYDELKELRANTTQTWTDSYQGSGVPGFILTSNTSGYTDRSIFLPANGINDNTHYDQSYGYYWQKTTSDVGSSEQTSYWLFDKSNYNRFLRGNRSYGMSVRPVRSK